MHSSGEGPSSSRRAIGLKIVSARLRAKTAATEFIRGLNWRKSPQRMHRLLWNPAPYVYVLVDEKIIARTHTADKSREPEWEQSFFLGVKNGSKLTLQLFDSRSDTLFQRQNLIGVADVPIEGLFDQSSGWKVLSQTIDIFDPKGKKSGTIDIQLDPDPTRYTRLNWLSEPKQASERIAMLDKALRTKQDAHRPYQPIAPMLELIGSTMTMVSKFVPGVDVPVPLLDILRKQIDEQQNRDIELRKLVESIHRLFIRMGDSESVVARPEIKTIVHDISNQLDVSAKFILELIEKKRLTLMSQEYWTSNQASQDLAAHLRNWGTLKERYELALRDQDLDINMRRAQREERLDREGMRKRQKLNFAAGALWDPDAGCLDGTRREISEQLNAWSLKTDSRNCFVITGTAGTGKSSILTTFTMELARQGRLASCFFFKADVPGCNHPRLLFPTLAHHLSRNIPSSKEKLDLIDDAIENEAPAYQFEELIRKPTEAFDVTLPNPVVFVIDAMDECASASERRRYITALANGLARLSPFVKVLIAFRKEPDLLDAFHASNEVTCIDTDMYRAKTGPDIRRFFESRFSLLRAKEGWPSTEDMEILTEKADGLFVWAQVTSSFILLPRYDRKRQLEIVKNSDIALGQRYRTDNRLANIYLTLLRSAPFALNHLRYVLGCIVHLKSPLSPSALDKLLGLLPANHLAPLEFNSVQPMSLERVSCSDLVEELRPMFRHRQLGDFDTPLRLLHQSLVDFFRHEQDHSIGLPFNQAEFNLCMLQRCLSILSSSTGMSSASIPDEALRYAARFWVDHLSDCPPNSSELARSMVCDYLCHQLVKCVQWSVTAGVQHGLQTRLANSARWLQACPMSAHKGTLTAVTTSLLSDSQRVVGKYYNALATSTAQTLVSSLIFAPATSMYAALYQAAHVHHKSFGDRPSLHWPVNLAMLLGHTGSVRSAAFSPDGKRIVSGSADETVRIWDAESGAAVGEPMRGHTDYVESVAFSPDGKRIVSGSNDKTVRIWDAESGAAVGETMRGHTDWVRSVAFSPDGKRIVSGSNDETVRMWDAESGAAVGEPMRGHTHWVTSVVFSPDGKRIVSGSDDRTVRVWDAESGAAVGEPMRGHTDWVSSVAFSPDGKRIVSGSNDETVRVWDAESGAAVGEPMRGHTKTVLSVAFSPDGKRIVSGSHDVRIWDADSGAAVGEPMRGHTHWVRSVAFSLDGKRIVSGSNDETVRIWDAESGAAVGEQMRGHTNLVWSVAFSPDGKRIVSGSNDKTVRIWDAESGAAVGEPMRGHTDWVSSVAFSPDGKRIVSGSNDKTVRIWDAESGAAVGEPMRGHTDWVSSVAFSPDGKRIVSGSDDQTVRIWDAESGAAVGEPMRGHHWVRSVAFSPDGKRIVSGSNDETVRIWDAESGAAVGEPMRGHTNRVRSVAFSPDGKRIVSGSDDRTVRIWDAESGAAVGEPMRGHTNRVNSVVFSPDGKRIVSGSDDRTVRIWDAESGAAVGEPMRGHTDWVRSVAFSPDGKRIVSGSNDETVRIWDAESGAAVGEPMRGHTNRVNSVAFSPDGRRIVSGSRGSLIEIRERESPGETSSLTSSSLTFGRNGPSATTDSPSETYMSCQVTSQDGVIPTRCDPGWNGYVLRHSISLDDDCQPPMLNEPILALVMDNDGWVFVGNMKRVLWIPPEFRPIWSPCYASSVWMGRGAYRLKLDLRSLLNEIEE